MDTLRLECIEHEHGELKVELERILDQAVAQSLLCILYVVLHVVSGSPLQRLEPVELVLVVAGETAQVQLAHHFLLAQVELEEVLDLVGVVRVQHHLRHQMREGRKQNVAEVRRNLHVHRRLFLLLFAEQFYFILLAFNDKISVT